MRSIRRPLAIGTVLSALVALPALFARPWADERFVMYMPEKLVGGNPFLLWDQVMREVTAFIDTGVFRPLSRLAFYLEHWLVVRTAIITGIAPNVVMSVVKVVMIALVLATGLVTLDQYRRASGTGALMWKRVTVLLPVVFAGSLVLVNPAVHPLTLFPGLYLGTAAAALAVPLWMGRALLHEVDPPRPWIRYGLAAFLGMVLASMIELAWFGVPLALAHLCLLYAQQHGWRRMAELRHQFALRLWAALAAGFTVVFIPARLFIAHYCATMSCYEAAAPSLGTDFLLLLPFRIGSAFAPVGLLAKFDRLMLLARRPSGDLLISFFVALAAVLLLAITWRSARPEEDEVRLGPAAGARTLAPAALYYAIVIMLASVLSAISAGLQAKGFNPAPWRETGFGWIAWAVLLSLALAVVTERFDSRAWLTAGLVLFLLTVMATTVLDREDMRRVGLDTEGILHIRAGQQLADFDPGANDSRCETIAGLSEVARNESELRKMGLVATYLDAAALNNYGVVFCDDSS